VARGVCRIQMAVARVDQQRPAARHGITRIGGKVGDCGFELCAVNPYRPDVRRQ
jgi:hypothetical protein